MKKPKVGVLSLGCPRNLTDSEGILGRLIKKGCRLTDIEHADVAIINTCAFIKDAKEESVESILKLIDLKRSGKIKKIIVYGCLAQRYSRELSRELPEIDAIVGRSSLNHSDERFPLTPGYYAYLKICEGCVNACSYCVIPKIKGKFSSLGREELLKKAASLDDQAVKEINIIGQDITGYGIDTAGKPILAEVLKDVVAANRNARWFRLLYLHPQRVNSELLHVIRDNPRICRYIDLPIQHINDRILRAMNRRCSASEIKRLIDKIRKMLPDVALRSAVIVGFPGETEKEFGQLLKFIASAGFERLGAFAYSREEGTKAFDYPAQVHFKTKQRRLNELMLLQQEVAAKVNKRFLGRELDVLIEENPEPGLYLGRTQYDAPEVDGQVYVRNSSPANRLKPGDMVSVRITDTMEYDLTGEYTPALN